MKEILFVKEKENSQNAEKLRLRNCNELMLQAVNLECELFVKQVGLNVAVDAAVGPTVARQRC